MADCPHCGKSFGNEGAASSHAAHCKHNPNNQQSGAPARPAQGQQGQAPANMPDNPAELGLQAGQMAAGLRSDDPVESARAKRSMFEAVWSAVGKAGQEILEEEEQQAHKAKEHGGEELEASDEYPTCKVCNGAIKRIPDRERFDCPHCDTVLQNPEYA